MERMSAGRLTPQRCPAGDILKPGAGLNDYPWTEPFLSAAFSEKLDGVSRVHRFKRHAVQSMQDTHRRQEITTMDYCGVEFTAVKSAEGSSWKWQLSILDKDWMKTSGEAASRKAAIKQAHEAIGEGLRANSCTEDEAQMPQLACDAVHVLHGARGLPFAEAVEALRPFMNGMHDRVPGSDPLADAAAAAVGALMRRLEARGVATDDLWEEAIEASLSFANKAS
jgi:hypothetical protein